MKELSCLIVDDDPIQQSLLKSILATKFKFDFIITAQDGLEAKIKTNNQKFDLIITDLNMPKKDGMCFIKESIIAKSFAPNQVILISGSLGEKEVKDAIENKISNILVKPFETSRLQSLITEILRHH